MTSKLWVYGDSFANSEFDLGPGREISWPYLLSKHFDEYESHARWGVGNDWIINQFMQNNPGTKSRSDRDIGIFIFSHPRRMCLPIHEGKYWLQSHTYTDEDNRNRGELGKECDRLQIKLKKRNWFKDIQEQVMYDPWRWRYMIDLQLHVLNTYSEYFDMLIVHSGFVDSAFAVTKSDVWNHKRSEGFVFLDLMTPMEHPQAQGLPTELQHAPCHMTKELNHQYYKIMLAACTTFNVKRHLVNGWKHWSDIERNIIKDGEQRWER